MHKMVFKLILDSISKYELYNLSYSVTTIRFQKRNIFLITNLEISKTHARLSSKSIYCLHLIHPKSSQRQKEGKQRCHICGLGAKVGCEHISEHSTCSDESHKYGIVASLPSSVLSVFVCYPSNE